MLFRSKNGVHGKYLYYLLKSMDLASMNVGSAVPSLTAEVLNKVEISLPNLTTQRQIAQILSSLDDKNNYILTPGRYIDFKEVVEDGQPFGEKMQMLTSTLSEQMRKANELDEAIKLNLSKIGYTL